MPFINSTILAAHTSQAKLDAMTTNENTLAQVIAESDSIIQTHTGIVPPEDANDAKKIFHTIAADIALWNLAANAENLSEEDIDLFEARFNNSMKLLSQFASGEISLPPDTEVEITAPETASTRRVARW